MAACGGGESPPEPDPFTTVVEVPATPNRDLDLLFVVDNSGTMADKQQTLADNFPNLVNQLNGIPGGLPNLHLGVISTDMGTKTSSSPTPATGVGTIGQGGCASTGDNGTLQLGQASGLVTGNFISDIALPDGTRQQNYTGNDLSTTFAAMAKLGATGCGFEQPLASMKTALDSNPANAGFLRPSALLAIVFLTDEDDCSVTDPTFFDPSPTTLGPQQSFRCTRFGVTCDVNGQTSDAMNEVNTKDGCHPNESSTLVDGVAQYRDFLVDLKGDEKRVIVGGIIGTPTPVATELRTINGTSIEALAHSCSVDVGGLPEVADPGVRMQAFFDLFPGRNTSTTICQLDFSIALENLGNLVAQAAGTPCVGAPLVDIDEATVGVQADCVVEDVVGANVTVIEPCDDAGTPTCWRMVEDATTCPLFDHLRLEVVRDAPPDVDTVTRARCRAL